QLFTDPRFNPLLCTDFIQHAFHSRRRSAVQGPLQRPDRRRDGGDEIGTGGRDHPRGEGGSIHPVFRRQNEVSLQRPDVGGGGNLPLQEIQIVGRVGKIRSGFWHLGTL